MYFLEQIRRQFIGQVIRYNHHVEAGFGSEVQDESVVKPQEEGPKGPDDVIAHARETNARLDGDLARESQVARNLGVGGEGSETLAGDDGNDTLSSGEGVPSEGLASGELSEGMVKLNESLGEDTISELTEKYGEEKLEAFSEIYARLIEEGVETPENAEEFEALMLAEIAKREGEELAKEFPDELADEGALANAARNVLSGSSAGHIRGYNGVGGERGRNFDFPSGNATQDVAQLDNAIQEAPNEQAKALLMTARRYVGMNETTHQSELKSFLGFDPKSTPWCKGFTNACCKEANIPLNSSGSLYSRAGVNDGRKLNLPQEKPQAGDIVIVERAGSVGNGAPAGHICVFLGMSPSGNPIVVGGNQGGSREGGGGVTITEEKRSIVSINRVTEERHA